MTEITVDATKIGIEKPIKIVRSFAMQRKAKVLQESLSKAALDSQEEFADLTKDGGFLASLKQDKSEDNKSLERLEKKYKVTSGITDPDFWDTRVNSVGNVIMVKLDGLQKFSSYDQIEEYISFIEDLADINTKKEKDKFENNEKLTTDNIIEVGQEIIGKILGIEDMEATEDDEKVSPSEMYKFWKDSIEDQDYVVQQSVINAHMSPTEMDNMDVDRWNEIMGAKATKDRPVDMFDFIKNQQLQGKGKEVK